MVLTSENTRVVPSLAVSACGLPSHESPKYRTEGRFTIVQGEKVNLTHRFHVT